MSRAVGFWVALLFVFGGSMLIWQISKMRSNDETVAGAGSHVEPDEESVVETPHLTEFELIDQRGNRVSSNSLAGKVWAGSFFFAQCPGTCYHQNMKLAELHSKYADQGLQIFSITCDPSNDTPVALASYASRFNADVDSWKFLTPSDGDMSYLKQIGRECLGVAVDNATHTDRVVLFGRDGESVGVYSVLKPEQFAELDRNIEKLLADAGGESAGPLEPTEESNEVEGTGATETSDDAASETSDSVSVLPSAQAIAQSDATRSN